MNTVRVGMLGCGTVGEGVLRLLQDRADRLEGIGVRVQLEGVLVRDLARPRRVPPGTPLTTDASFLPRCDLVIEVMGGVDRPLELLLPVLRAGRPVVTANKALLAERWDELRPYVQAGLVHYEASVMAGTPVLGPLSTVLRASRVTRLMALLNATSNHILTGMESGRPYEEVLAEAQREGMAEDPPTLDVGGWDAAHKLTLIARLVADPAFRFEDVQVSGIDALPDGFVADAVSDGRRVRLVSELWEEDGGWRARVSALTLSADHPLCSPAAARNGLWLDGEGCSELFLAGGGKGGLVTASAVVGDVFGALSGVPGQRPLPVV